MPMQRSSVREDTSPWDPADVLPLPPLKLAFVGVLLKGGVARWLVSRKAVFHLRLPVPGDEVFPL